MNYLKRVVGVGPVLALLGVLAGCSASGSDQRPEESFGEGQASLSVDECPAGVPASLLPPAGESLKSKVSAVGVQIYSCNAKPDNTYAWTLLAPQANLFNDDGRFVGTHFIGPTWQSNDGSSVAGVKAAGATMDASAVPWLLVKAVSHAADEGRLSDVSYVQRLSTVGGLAPTDTCDATHNLGAIVQVPYSADYFFYHTKTFGKVKQCGGN
jgi:hypothetical protein